MHLLPFLLLALLLGGWTTSGQAASTKPHPHANRTARHKAHRADPSHAAASGPLYATRVDVLEQADRIASARALDPGWVRQAIGQARYQAAIARAILPPPSGVAKNWEAYRKRFVEPVRIRAGTQFWLANRETLQRAEAQTGVPAAIIVGILGVETLYGRDTGNYRVIDALCTLAFDFPAAHPKAEARAAFFRNELEEYLVLTARTHTDPLALRGSYAGALGWPQFMPSSWARYAVDFDGDGRIDLFHSTADVIGSVAHYFEAFHWQPGMPTHYAVQLDATRLDLAPLRATDILPHWSVAELAAHGVLVEPAGQQHTGPLALIDLENGDAEPLYVAGTDNFYAITRYNWSSYYAMGVIALGQAVAEQLNSRAAGVQK